MFSIAPLFSQNARLMLSSDFPQAVESAQFSEDGQFLLLRSFGQYKLVDLSAMREIPLPALEREIFDRLYLGRHHQLWHIGEFKRDVYDLQSGESMLHFSTLNISFFSSEIKSLNDPFSLLESRYETADSLPGRSRKRLDIELMDTHHQKWMFKKENLLDYFISADNTYVLTVNDDAIQMEICDSLMNLQLQWLDTVQYKMPNLQIADNEVFVLEDNVVVCYNITDGAIKWKKENLVQMQSLVWVEQLPYLAGLSADRLKWKMFDVNQERMVFEWDFQKPIQQFSIAPDRRWIAFLYADGSCAMLDVKRNILIDEGGRGADSGAREEKNIWQNQLTWSPDSKWCFVQSIGMKYRIWNSEKTDFNFSNWIQSNPFLEKGKWNDDLFVVPIDQGHGLIQFNVKSGDSEKIAFYNFDEAKGNVGNTMTISASTKPASFTIKFKDSQDTVASIHANHAERWVADPIKMARDWEGNFSESLYYFTTKFLGKYNDKQERLDTLFLAPVEMREWFFAEDDYFLGITMTDEIFTFHPKEKTFRKAMEIPLGFEMGKVEWNTLNQSWHLILNKEGDDPHLFLRKWCSIDRNGKCVRNVDLPRLVKSLGLIEFDWNQEKLFLGGDTIVEYSISNLKKPLTHYVCPVENCNEIIWESPNHLVLCYPFQCDILDWDRKVVLDSLIDRRGIKSISDWYFRRFPMGNLWLGMTLKGRVEIYDKDSKKMDYMDDAGYWLSPSSDHSLLMGVQAQQLNVIDVASRQIKYHLRIFENGDWLAYDDDYHYDGTPGAREQLYFTCGLEIIELAQLKDALYVPGLVDKIMSGQPIQYPKLSELEICGTLPLIEKEKDAPYHYTITPRKLGLKRVELYVNGKRVMSKKPEELKKVEKEFI